MKQLAIVGYGKMGRAIERLAADYGFEVALRLDSQNNANCAGMTPEAFEAVDVAVEFTSPEVARSNVLRLCELGINTVCGTTGWSDDTGEVIAAVESSGIGFVIGQNFSVGVNMFLRLVADAAKYARLQIPPYEAWAWEIHHSGKKDAPSGTMRVIEQVMELAAPDLRLDVASNRAGAHPGTHEVGFDSGDDTITLRHTARTRDGFARGALMAAAWIGGRAGLHTFEDVLADRGGSGT